MEINPLPKRYHINPETGRPAVCVAKHKCRYGADAVHYPSMEDAAHAYERMMTRYEERGRQRPTGTVTNLPEGIAEGSVLNLAPGKYFLGDPYLTIAPGDQQGWGAIVDSIGDQFGWENDIAEPADEKAVAVGAVYEGEPVLALKSWHGEGLHWSIGPTRRLPSETGLMGFISEETLALAGMTREEAEKKKLGMAVDLDEETMAWRDENGIIILGGRLLIFHNDLVQPRWFNSLSAADGINNKVPTRETYEHLVERAQAWVSNPYATRQSIG